MSLPVPLTTAMSAAPSPDPRVGLRGGWFDAAQAIWNMDLVSSTRPSEAFINPDNPQEAALKSSDLAFVGNTVFQGNYSGWQAWDVTNPRSPRVVQTYVCPGAQSDVSVYRNLLFVSHEGGSRMDCGLGAIREPVSPDRARGVRIYDISNIASPRRVTMVQTCRGSHTHTLVTDPNDRENVYIYVSGTSGVRSPEELPGCSSGSLAENPNTAEFRLEVIQVPVANPERAQIVTSPRVFNDLTRPPSRAGGGGGGRGGRAGGGRGAGAAAAGAAAGAATPEVRPGPNQCHDITVYKAVGLAGGACGGLGLLLDISDVRNPVRIDAVADSNMSFWHSATFSNDGRKVLFSDEWGGGRGAMCQAIHRPEWGADAIFTIDESRKMVFRGYYKMPAPQTEFENCVAHNGSLIPIPGREIMVQSWYQGGISIFEWTDPANAKEIAFFDRGPLDPTRLTAAGHWSAYWYNGYIYGSEEYRGLDILELKPSPFLSQNEIDAAKTVRLDQFNPQDQQRFVWPPSFVLARSYLDQLARDNGIALDRATAISGALSVAERGSGAARRDALTQLASQLDADTQSARDAARVRMLASAVRELAAATR
jgi:hypothetical protein